MCGKTKSLACFPKNRGRADGHHSYCKPCKREYSNKLRKKREIQSIKDKKNKCVLKTKKSKVCSICNKEKKASEFWKSELKGSYGRCKDCMRQKERENKIKRIQKGDE